MLLLKGSDFKQSIGEHDNVCNQCEEGHCFFIVMRILTDCNAYSPIYQVAGSFAATDATAYTIAAAIPACHQKALFR